MFAVGAHDGGSSREVAGAARAAAALPRENVFGHRKKLDLIRASLGEQRQRQGHPLRILDVGCGNGRAVTQFLGSAGDHVTGLDVHEQSIAYAREHFGSQSMEFRVSTLQELRTEAGFDAIVLSDVLEHVEDPESLLQAAAELLAADGCLIVSVPNGYGPFEIESALGRVPVLGPTLLKMTDLFVALLNKTVLRGAWNAVVSADAEVPYNIESGHIQFFRRKALQSMFVRHNLHVTQFRKLSFMSGPFTNYLFAPSRCFCAFNCWVANLLPAAVVSAWFFVLGRNSTGARAGKIEQ